MKRALCLIPVALTLLAGCSPDHEELRAWMEQQRREAKPNVKPLQPPKKFDPQPYEWQ